jgi:hypothetical protein
MGRTGGARNVEAEFDEIDRELTKLEGELAQAGDENARHIIEEQIARLRDLRAEIAAQGDILLAAGAGNVLEDEAEAAIEEIRGDIP